MKSIPVLIFLALANLCHAELLPPLQAAADKHKQAAKAIFDERFEAVIKLQDPYLAELKTAETKATESGAVDALKAIATEKQLVEHGPIPQNPPGALPRSLHPARKIYFRNYERLNATLDKRRSELDSAYLSELAKMLRDHTNDETWKTQVASEKARVLAGAGGPISDMRIGLAGTRWLNNNDGKGTRSFLTDGTVKEGDGRGGWKYETPDAQTVIIHWGGDNHMPMHLQKDGKTLTDYNGSWSLLPSGGE